MPYPAQIDPERLIEQARAMIAAEGLDNLSLHRLAATMGVKAPSLYRHFASKNDLLRAVNLQTSQRLVKSIQEAMTEEGSDDPRAKVMTMAQAYHTFAHTNPMTYTLLFSNLSPELRPDPVLLEQLALPLQRVMAMLSGEPDSLAALRGLWALLHGFVTLELNGQFQRGGDIDQAFIRAIEAYIAGWTCAE